MNPNLPLSGLTRAALLACTLSLAACASFPGREPRAQMKPAQRYASAQAFSAPTAAWPAERWWSDYRDPQLDALIAEALADAPNIAVAEARLRRAQALAQVSHAATQPQATLNASASQQKQSSNYLSPAAATPQGWNDYGRASLDLAWELDFWGRNRAALAAATSEAEATQADLAQARLTLATSIAAANAELARLHAALDTAQAALNVRARTAELFGQRRDNGLETLGSVRQVQARHAAAAADLRALEEQLTLQRHRIAALMGAGPDRGLALQRPADDQALPIGLPERLEAELLGPRPDVIAARLRAEAAARRIDQAQAAFYPNVNLVAFIGLQSLGLNMLGSSGSTIGSVGPAVSLPVFDGGRLRGQLRASDAEYAEAVASYERTVVQALQDVADAAASRRALGGQLEKTDEAVAASREAWRLQNDRYQGGLSTYLDVLGAEDTLLSNLRSQSDLRARAFALDVALVRALGGGYASPAS
jgi:NodT family efflux transporter outer membrane factor (OMF) lipoprotein